MTTRERLRGILAGLVLVVGVVLSPLRAAAATIPMLVAYDAAVRPAATTRVDAGPSLRPDRGSTPEYVYDDAPAGHDGGTKLGAERGTGVVRAYDRALQLTERRELVEGLINDAPFATTAAEGLGPTAARTFTSSDPLVADLANSIEAAYPGHVVGVNVPMYNAAGELATDADILLQNAVIQVKSGSGAGLTSQLARTQAVTDLPVIGYGPQLGGAVFKGIQAAGGLVTRDAQLLIGVVAP